MTCQQTGCTRKAELACTVGERRQVLCIEHQARYRQAMSCGGRMITVHHGVDLEKWSPLVRRSAPEQDNDVPDLGLPHSFTSHPPSNALRQLDFFHAPPQAPPVPPPTLRLHLASSNKPRLLCFWTDCKRDRHQGVGCKYHNDRLRMLYGTASGLAAPKLDAAPVAWLEYETSKLSKATLPVKDVVPVVKDVVPVVKDCAGSVKDKPNVALALVLLDAVAQLNKDRTIRTLLDAARAVLA